MNELPISYLREILKYDPNTGIIEWRQRPLSHFKSQWAYIVWNKRFANKAAGSKSVRRYMNIEILGTAYKAHRIAFALHYGEWPSKHIDHIDGNSVNNRISNLRDVDQLVNAQNKRRPNKNNSTGFLGVKREGNKYMAKIRANGKDYMFCGFDDAESAHKKYLEEKRKMHAGCTI